MNLTTNSTGIARVRPRRGGAAPATTDTDAPPLRVTEAAKAFLHADPMTLAASIAFYTALSFAPIVVLSLAIAAQLWPHSELRLVDQLGGLLGEQVGDVARLVVESGRHARFVFTPSGIVSLVALIVSASTALAQLQDAINRIWRTTPTSESTTPGTWLRRRLLSLGMIAVVGFFLVVSLVVSTLLSAALTREGWAWVVVNEAITVAVFTLAFAALFRFVPDEKESWRPILLGAFATALLFDGGKWALGAYLAGSDQADAYGTSGSVVLLLVWVYYSSLIVLVGAGLTRWVAERRDARAPAALPAAPGPA